jgi:DNA repair exonuclease SbcCD nuclease subunit
MPITFVHTADWQLGAPFRFLPEAVATELRAARLDVIARIAEAARRADARHVLVAGDVFDSATAPSDLIGRVTSILEGHRDLAWHLLPGNHDPARPGSVWERMQARITSRASSNIHLHLEEHAFELAPGVVLLPAPLRARATATDPTAWMDDASTPAGTIRVGLAHGSVQGFSGDGDASVPIAPTRPKAARLDYLALGDWHGTTRISDHAWYAGTPEVDRFPDNDPGHVLVVTIDRAGAVPRVETVETSIYTWVHRRQTVSRIADVEALASEIQRLGPAGQKQLWRVALDGALSIEDLARAETIAERLREDVKHLDWSTEKIVPVGALRADAIASGVLGRIVQDLSREAATVEPSAATAHRALFVLSRLLAEEADER